MQLQVKRSVRPVRQLLRVPVNMKVQELRVPVASYSGSFVVGDYVQRDGSDLVGEVLSNSLSGSFRYIQIQYPYGGLDFNVSVDVVNLSRTGTANADLVSTISQSNIAYNVNFVWGWNVGDTTLKSGGNPPAGTVVSITQPIDGYIYLLLEHADENYNYAAGEQVNNQDDSGRCKPDKVTFEFSGTATETNTVLLEVDEDTLYFRELMGAEKITAISVQEAKIDLQIGDYIEWEGLRYSLKRAPKVDKQDNSTLEYTAVFYSPAYDLYERMIRDEGSTSFNYTSAPEAMLQLIIDSMGDRANAITFSGYTGSTPAVGSAIIGAISGAHGIMLPLATGWPFSESIVRVKMVTGEYIAGESLINGSFVDGVFTATSFDATVVSVLEYTYSEWEIDEVDVLDPITLGFRDQSCRTALTKIAEEFGLEYAITGKSIKLIAQVGAEIATAMTYGRNNAIKEIKRESIDDEFATIWYGYGSSRNLPSSYRSNLNRLSFDRNPIYKNTQIYGPKEATIVFDDIYPKFEGTVSVVIVPTVFWAPTPFDVDDYVLTDGSAKVVFLTGDLAGNEFTITAFSLSGPTGIYTIAENVEENGYTLPNDTVKPQVGDTFTIVGISLPDSYVEAAETALEEATEAWADANSAPKVKFEIIINEQWVREEEPVFTPGDQVFLSDLDTDADGYIRVQSVEYPLVRPEAMRLFLSNSSLVVATPLPR